jgi:anaerobic selenocysteine-containing dehydrogenase
MVRKYLLDGTPREKGRGEWVEVDWETALDLTANKLRFAETPTVLIVLAC